MSVCPVLYPVCPPFIFNELDTTYSIISRGQTPSCPSDRATSRPTYFLLHCMPSWSRHPATTRAMDAEGPPPLLATPHRARTVSTSTLLNEAAPLLGGTAPNEPVKATARLVCLNNMTCSLECVCAPVHACMCVRAYLSLARIPVCSVTRMYESASISLLFGSVCAGGFVLV